MKKNDIPKEVVFLYRLLKDFDAFHKYIANISKRNYELNSHQSNLEKILYLFEHNSSSNMICSTFGWSDKECDLWFTINAIYRNAWDVRDYQSFYHNTTDFQHIEELMKKYNSYNGTFK